MEPHALLMAIVISLLRDMMACSQKNHN